MSYLRLSLSLDLLSGSMANQLPYMWLRVADVEVLRAAPLRLRAASHFGRPIVNGLEGINVHCPKQYRD